MRAVGLFLAKLGRSGSLIEDTWSMFLWKKFDVEEGSSMPILLHKVLWLGK